MMNFQKVRLSLMSLFLLGTLLASGQLPVFDWCLHTGEMADSSAGIQVLADSEGNTLNLGYFFGTIDLDPGPGLALFENETGTDYYIQKLDAEGDLIWAKVIEGSGEFSINEFDVDDGGNIYATGDLSGPVDFDPGIGQQVIEPVFETEAFILKLDGNGNFVWVDQPEGFITPYDLSSTGIGLKVDSSGNIVVIGLFSGIVDFDPGPGSYLMFSMGFLDGFVLKMDSERNFDWVGQISDPLSPSVFDVEIDASDFIFISGSITTFTEFVFDFETEEVYPSFIGNTDAFIQKISPTGATEWVKTFGGTSFGSTTQGGPLAVDNFNQVIFSGTFDSSIEVNNETTTYSSQGQEDIFIVKLGLWGIESWATVIGGPNEDICQSIAVDPFNNLFFSGTFQDSVDFDPGEGIEYITSSGSGPEDRDIFLFNTDENGEFIYARNFGASNSVDAGKITVDPDNNIYLTGKFSGQIDFDPTIEEQLFDSESNQDAFTLKLGECSPGIPIPLLADLPIITGDCEAFATDDAPIATDGCGNALTGIPNLDLPFTFQQDSSIIWTYTTFNGLSSTQEQLVDLADPIPPIPISGPLPTIIALCEVTLDDVSIPFASDNCPGPSLIEGFPGNVSFPINNTSVSEIEWVYDDGNGNTTIQIQPIIWEELDLSVSFSDGTIVANNPDATYQWLDCENNFIPISGANSQVFTPVEPGVYAVIISQDGCGGMSECVVFNPLNSDDRTKEILFDVFPNPASDIVTLRLVGFDPNLQIEVYNGLGQLVLQMQVQQMGTEFNEDLNLEELVSGVYLIQVTDGQRKVAKRLVKE